MATKHTSTPWQASTENPLQVRVLSPSGAVIALALGDHAESVANAKHIAKCVNAHDMAAHFAIVLLTDLGHTVWGEGEDEDDELGYRAPRYGTRWYDEFERVAAWLVQNDYATWERRRDVAYVALRQDALPAIPEEVRP